MTFRYRLFVFGVVWMFAASAALAAAPGAGTQGSLSVTLDDPPLALATLTRVPALQPSSYDGRAQRGYRQAAGNVIGAWRYKLNYRYTASGWQVSGYGFTRVAASDLATQPMDRQVNLLPPPSPGANFPPGPGDVPVPDRPSEDPGGSHHFKGAKCPYPGHSGWDISFDWEWIPTHTETDDWGDGVVVDGHWDMTGFHVTESPSDFCG